MTPAPNPRVGLPAARRTAAVAALVATVLFVLLAFLVAGHWSPLERLDGRTARRLNDYIAVRSSQAHAWQLGSDVLAPTVLRVALLIAAAVLRLRRDTRRALLCAATAVGSLVVDSAVKLIVGRPRPVVPHPVAHAAGASFPSGHALTSAATAICVVAIAWAGRRLRLAVAVVAGGLAVAVGFSRLILGVHFVSDVVGGWLGAVALGAGLIVLLPVDRRP